MQLGTQIEIPGIRGADGLSCNLPEVTTSRRVKVYLVPESTSADRYYISIRENAGAEVFPPSRGRDTVLLADFSQDESGKVSTHYINEEVENA